MAKAILTAILFLAVANGHLIYAWCFEATTLGGYLPFWVSAIATPALCLLAGAWLGGNANKG